MYANVGGGSQQKYMYYAGRYGGTDGVRANAMLTTPIVCDYMDDRSAQK